MSIETQSFFEKKPFGVRLTDDEISFIRENYDDLFDGDESIQPRKAFMLIVEKALSKIKKNNQSLPEDVEKIRSLQIHINELTKELEECQNRQRELSSQFNDAVNRKIVAEKKAEELSENLLNIQEKLQKVSELTVEPVLEATDRLLKLTPLESFVLAQIEKVHACDAKEILINRMFMVYQRRGNGDYDIKRITPAAFAQIEAHIKNS